MVVEEKNIRTVFIVDDDRIIRELLQKELKRNFYNSVVASNGKSAIEAFKKEPFDILLLDLKLPDIDGLELLKKAKKLRPDCEVIVITGYGSQETAIQSLRYGAIDYVEKPIDINELSTAIGRAVEKLIEKKTLLFQNTLLVIDDDEGTSKHLAKYLKKEGYVVFTASNGKKGLDVIENNKIDVVVTDIKMDDMDGIEVLQKTKKLYKDIEVIMVTGYQEYAVRSLRAGAFDYIAKPVNLEELLFSINKAIERINLKRNSLYRHRELMISSEIMGKMNVELERRIEKRTKELGAVQTQLFQTSKLAILGETSAGLAHEMNQPLGGISLVAKHFRKLLERDKLTEKEIISGLDDIEFSVKRMAKVIQHVRTFARQDTMEFVSVDLNKTIESGMELLTEQMRLHEIEVGIDLMAELPKIIGEPYQLEQVWINLISNARDAMDQQEDIILNGKDQAQTNDYKKKLQISTNWDQNTGHVEACVKDNGAGIADTIKNKVFEPFFTTKEVGKAVGLGLSISYGIIESHQGKIEIKSNEGEGTTVYIKLPIEVKNSE